jgi:uncharacterized protein
VTNFIDRRLNSRDKNLTNRQKFLERAKGQIKEAVDKAITSGNVGDINSKKVSVPVRGIKEPTFTHDSKTGNKKYVHPGNKEYVVGDAIEKPKGGSGSGGGSKASNEGEGEDEFTFTLTKEEFLEYFFDNLELPDLVKKQISDIKKETPKRAGFTTVGNPAQLDVKSTAKQALGRRIALKRPHNSEIDELEKQIEESKNSNPIDQDFINELNQRLSQLKRKIKAVPWIDPVDTRYRLYVPQPMPITKAVMVCLMDVSGSMTDKEKTIAKKFFMLLSILLHHKYEAVEIVFVRHHTQAEECNEHDFFYKKETGGTVVSSGLQLVNEILKRYSDAEYNKYVCQASDGDNWNDDNKNVIKELQEMIPTLQYFAYLDIPNNLYNNGDSDLWNVYKKIQTEYPQFEMAKAKSEKDIWTVFQELFAKKETTND